MVEGEEGRDGNGHVDGDHEDRGDGEGREAGEATHAIAAYGEDEEKGPDKLAHKPARC